MDLQNYVEREGCHEWQGAMRENGTGSKSGQPVWNTTINGKRKTFTIIREVWTRAGRSLPKGHIVYRTCCNHKCIRLAHLACGPRGSAHKHRAKLGLMKHGLETIAKITEKARARPSTKYSPELAAKVRELVPLGLTNEEISKRTGVSVPMVSDIRTGSAWRAAARGASVFNYRP